jgi:hypothetical protein
MKKETSGCLLVSDRRCVRRDRVKCVDFAAHESNSPDALADIDYGDERKAAETGQSEIVVTSRSESATGREREQVNLFTFDKVGPLLICMAEDRFEPSDCLSSCWSAVDRR